MSRLLGFVIFYGWCVCVALVSPLGQATAQPVRSDISPSVQSAEFEGFRFPREVARMPRRYKVDYRMPGLGFSVMYGTPGDTWADIYVYDKQADLAAGSPNKLSREELDVALGDVQEQVKMGLYEKAALQSQSVSGSFARAHLKIAQGGREYHSFVFITVHNGKFVKIRLTSNLGPDADLIAKEFVAAYGSLLKTP
jgi:hypothetical protein